MSAYRVQLDTYTGPLDLLLYLIRQEEVDIYDIPIARITEHYVTYVGLLKILDPDSVSEYLVLLATLIEIKSRMLLPRAPVEDEDQEDLQDPRMDLVRKLLEYKRYKDAARELAEAAEEHARRFPSRPISIEREPGEQELEDVQVWDLLAAFNAVMARIGHVPDVHEVVYDDTPMALHAADLQDRLQRENGSLPFERVFLGRSRADIIGLFLALLELIRQRRVRARQEGLFGVIVLYLIDASPLEMTEAEPDTLPEPAPDATAQEVSTETRDELVLDEEGEQVRDEELDAIDRALDRVTDRLEQDRQRRRAVDRTGPASVDESGEAP